MSTPQEDNARRLIAIARESGTPAARRLLTAATLHNDRIVDLAPELLDTPAFVLAELAPREAVALLQGLEDGTLHGLGKDDPACKTLIDQLLSEDRRAKIAAAAPEVGANRKFFKQLAANLGEGKITFDPGLLFQTLRPCPAAHSGQDGGWRVVNPTRTVAQNEPATLYFFGPARTAAVFTLQLGSIVLLRTRIYTNHAGQAELTFQPGEHLKPLAEEDRARSKLLFACLRAGQTEDAAYLALRPLAVDDDFALTDGDRPLELFAAYIEANDDVIVVTPLLKDRGDAYRGAGVYSLRCLRCGSSIGTIEHDHEERADPPDLQFPTRGHFGPFQLSFTAGKSGRRVSLDLGTPALNPIEREAGPGESMRMPGEFKANAAVEIEPPGEALIVYVLAPGKARHLLRTVADDLITGLAFAAGDGNHFQRATRLVLPERAGRQTSARALQTGPSGTKYTIAENLDPGRYAFEYLRIENGRIADEGRREFVVQPAPRIFAPARLHPDDAVEGVLIAPGREGYGLFDIGDRPIEGTVADRTLRFRLPFDRKQNTYRLKSRTNGKVDHRPIAAKLYDHRSPQVTGFAPISAAASGPAAESEAEAEAESSPANATAGSSIGINELLVELAWNLWNYGHSCAEQTSARLFAYAVLHSTERKADLLPERHDYLVRLIRHYYDPKTGFFYLWDGLQPDGVTTSRVLRNLAVFRGTRHPLSAFIDECIKKLTSRAHKDDALAFLDPAFATAADAENEQLSGSWEKLWRGKPEWQPDFGTRFLYSLVKDGAGLSSADRSAFWSPAEIKAIAFWAGTLIGEAQLDVRTETRTEVRLSFWQRLLKALGLGGGPSFKISRTSLRVPNPAYDAAAFAENFIRQSGATLFGATSATVVLLQALLSLRKDPRGKELRFSKASVGAAREIQSRPDVHWEIPGRVQIGKPYRLRIKVDSPLLRRDGVIAVHCPAHSKLTAADAMVADDDPTFGEFPVRGRPEIQIELDAILTGRARITLQLTAMYDPRESATHSAMISVS